MHWIARPGGLRLVGQATIWSIPISKRILPIAARVLRNLQPGKRQTPVWKRLMRDGRERAEVRKLSDRGRIADWP